MEKTSVTFTLKELIEFANHYTTYNDTEHVEPILAFVSDFTGMSIDAIIANEKN